MKKIIALLMALAMLFSFAACGKAGGDESSASAPSNVGALEEDDVTVRVGSMKGATSIGLAAMMYEDASNVGNYEFKIETAADAVVSGIIGKKLDIALVPANVASVVYNKTKGGVKVIDINTYNVLHFLSADTSIKSVADLKGKTIYLTGKGTTPDYVMQYLLAKAGVKLSEVTVEYKSEATEVLNMISKNAKAVGLLPQPFVTVALNKNAALKTVIDCGDAFANFGESTVVTGVTIVRNEFLSEHPAAVKNFLVDHANSVDTIDSDLARVSSKVVELGIIAAEGVAKKAIPECDVTCTTGEVMKKDLSSYLNILHGFNAASVGGALPAEDFYYVEK